MIACSKFCSTCTDRPDNCNECAANRINPPICECPKGFLDKLEAECLG